MLNSGKKIRALRDKNKNILTLVLSEKKFLKETNNHNHPPHPCKLNGRSLRSVPDLPIGSSLGPQNLGGLRPRCILFLTLLLDFSHLCCHNVLYFLNNPSVIFLTQLHSISEYCRILNTPPHLRLY
jgi:hypothetical protein